MSPEIIRSDTMKIGKVYLVGAGPGDPGLMMTLRGLHLDLDRLIGNVDGESKNC